jgi:hypothetical protein
VEAVTIDPLAVVRLHDIETIDDTVELFRAISKILDQE